MKKEDKIYLDEEGLKQYQAKIAELKQMLNNTVLIKSERHFPRTCSGEMNLEFEDIQARSEYHRIEGELRDLLSALSRVVIIKKDDKEHGADINDVISVKLTNSKGDVSADYFKLIAGISPKMNSFPIEITLQSPLGKAIFKKNEGDTGSYKVANQTICYEIIKIEKAKDNKMGQTEKGIN